MCTWMYKRQLKLEMSRTFMLRGCFIKPIDFPVFCLLMRDINIHLASQATFAISLLCYKTTFFSSLTAFSPSALSKAPGLLDFSFLH